MNQQNNIPTQILIEDLIPAYEFFVASKCKSGAGILATLTPEKCHLWHMASCIPGEAGELFDQIKKFLIYNKPITQEQIKEISKEMGDILFYIVGLINGLNSSFGTRLSLDFIIQENMEKLNTRYKAGYTDTEAQSRADVAIINNNGLSEIEEVNRQLQTFDPITEND